MDDEFIGELRQMCRSWGWTDRDIDETLPRLLGACGEVGIIIRRKDRLVVTPLAEDDVAWDQVRRILEKEGAGGGLAG